MPKRIGLFLGAGASKPFGLPTVKEFFGRVIWSQQVHGIRARGCEAATKELTRRIWISRGMQGGSPFPSFDSEWLFEDLQKIVDTTSLSYGGNLTGNTWTIPECSPQRLHTFLKREVVRVFGTPAKGSSKYSTGYYCQLIDGLKREIGIKGPLRIFTTNYDLIIEKFCRSLSDIQFIDGFGKVSGIVPRAREWSEQEYERETEENKLRIELYKLHGSVTWKWHTQAKKVVDMGQAILATKHDCLLYPGCKGIPSSVPDAPFWFLHEELAETLNRYELFVVIGFRFNDAYIRSIFNRAFRTNPKLKIVVVIPDRSELSDEISSWKAEGRKVDFLEVRFGESDFTEKLLEKIDGV